MFESYIRIANCRGDVLYLQHLATLGVVLTEHGVMANPLSVQARAEHECEMLILADPEGSA